MFSTHDPTMGLEASADRAAPDTQKAAATEQASTARNSIFLTVNPSLLVVSEGRINATAQRNSRQIAELASPNIRVNVTP
jgi:hypothetical protein